ncbi:MAG: NlpC/P60 family protein [Pseudomonadota bacterium]
MTGDPRVTLARADLAAAHLRGQANAARFVEPTPMRVTAPVLDVTDARGGALTTQFLFGERIEICDAGADGAAWGQAAADGYVGYMDPSGLAPWAPPTHRVRVLGTQLYRGPGLKQAPIGALPYAARVCVTQTQADFARLEDGRWCPAQHLAPLDAPAADFVAEARMFLGVPYLWGGRSGWGLDCSALVQLALAAAGIAAPRDSDQQEALGGPADGPARRGDLVFWEGHVGILEAPDRLLHANAHHMAVVSEDFETASVRIAATPTGPITARRRLADKQGG